MIRSASFIATFALFIPGLIAASDFKTGQSASLVVGQEDFTTTSLHSGGEGLNAPTAMAISPVSGKLFICDTARNRIMRYSSTATLENLPFPEAIFGVLNFAGDVAGTSDRATFAQPMGIAVDSEDRLWVADSFNNRVLRFDHASQLTTFPSADQVLGQSVFNNNPTGSGNTGLFNPRGVYADAQGNLWVADTANYRVVCYLDAANKAETGALSDSSLGFFNMTPDPASMNQPTFITGDAAGRIWVADGGNHRVLRFDNAVHLGSNSAASGVLGQPSYTTDTFGTTAHSFGATISGLFVTSSGRLFVADTGNHRVLWFNDAANKNLEVDADGVIGQDDFTLGSASNTDNHFNEPWGIAVDPLGRLWVADHGYNRALRFDPIAAPAVPHPTVAIHGKKKFTTSATKIVLKGTASDAGGTLAGVDVKVGKSAYRPANGTASWSLKTKLKPGKNTIFAQAKDTNGTTSAVAKVIIIRK